MIKSIKSIRAKVTKKWSHKNSKFKPKQLVHLDQPHTTSDISKTLSKYIGKVGTVIAVTCTPDGKIRGRTNNGSYRQRTKYYVRFQDRTIGGFDSHYLTAITVNNKPIYG